MSDQVEQIAGVVEQIAESAQSVHAWMADTADDLAKAVGRFRLAAS